MCDLRSDTVTLPTPAMREAMAAAPVGDDQFGEDPSVNRLCEMTAELLGKEAAVFLPSGTMCNQICMMLHCRPGDEVLCDKTAHIWSTEGGGAAVFALVAIMLGLSSLLVDLAAFGGAMLAMILLFIRFKQVVIDD